MHTATDNPHEMLRLRIDSILGLYTATKRRELKARILRECGVKRSRWHVINTRTWGSHPKNKAILNPERALKIAEILGVHPDELETPRPDGLPGPK